MLLIPVGYTSNSDVSILSEDATQPSADVVANPTKVKVMIP
jgi:hypothetical protein